MDNLERKKLDKVIEGTASVKKNSAKKKFLSMLFSDDIGDIKSYILYDIVIPAGKKALSGIVDTLLYGKNAPSRGPITGQYINYAGYSNQQQRPQQNHPRPMELASKYNNIILETRGDAEVVLNSLLNSIGQFGKVHVADLYDMVGLDCTFQDYKFGWYDLSNAYVCRASDGWSVWLPKPSPIE